MWKVLIFSLALHKGESSTVFGINPKVTKVLEDQQIGHRVSLTG